MTSTVRLGDIAEFINGGPWNESEYAESGIPVVRVSDFTENTVDLAKCKFLPQESWNKYSKHRLLAGDLVVATVGSHPTQPGSVVGRPVIIPQSAEGALLNQNAVCIRPKGGSIDKTYLGYLGCSKIFRDYIVAHARGAANQARMSIALLKEMSLALPPLPAQRKIAAILSTYDDLIENNTRRIKILEEIAQAIYREWFVHFRFPGHEKAKMIDSTKGKVPEGWLAARLGDVAEEVRRSVHPSRVHPDTPYFGLEHLPRKSIALSEWGVAGKVQSTKLAFEKGEILFGKIRPYFHKVGVAPVRGICSSDTIVIRPKEAQFFGIVLACVSSEAFVNHAAQTSQGTKMPRTNWEVLMKYPLLIPPAPLLLRFNEQMRQSVDLMHNLIFCNRNLRQTRDLLLPKMISGEVNVSELDVVEGNVGP